jgi:hypothetical protein
MQPVIQTKKILEFALKNEFRAFSFIESTQYCEVSLEEHSGQMTPQETIAYCQTLGNWLLEVAEFVKLNHDDQGTTEIFYAGGDDDDDFGDDDESLSDIDTLDPNFQAGYRMGIKDGHSDAMDTDPDDIPF